MPIRTELANRLRIHRTLVRSYASTLEQPSERVSFKDALVKQQKGGVAPTGVVPVRALEGRIQRPGGRYSKQLAPKDITLDQAHKLARHAPTIQECSRKYNVPVELICAVIVQESGGNPKAVSPAGAQGLMQLMPATAKRFGVTNPFDPRQNIEGGTKYLRFLLDRFHGDYKLALAGYNAGEKNVEKYGNKIPPFAETRAYVPGVLAYADTIYRILHTPPAVASLPSYARRA